MPYKYKQSIRLDLANRGITKEKIFGNENPDFEKIVAEVNNEVFRMYK